MIGQRVGLAAALLLLVAVGQIEGAQRSKPELAMIDTAAKLHAIEVPEDETSVPPAVSELLMRFKSQLRQTVVNAIAGEPADVSASLAQQSILHALRAEGITVDAESRGYGSVGSIEVERPRSEPDLLFVSVDLAIPCGSDTSLYVFQSGKLILAREAKPYDTVAGAQGQFSWRVSPPDRAGHWFVVTANINPWCSSNWQTLRYEVLRPGQAPDAPIVVLQSDSTVFMSDGYDLDVDAGSFTLTFIASQSLDAAVLTREHVVRMRIDGDHTQRVDPIARTPEGFLDEWLAGTWTDISHWSDASLEEMHDQMAATIAAGEKEDDFSKSLGSTVRCPGDREWIVPLELEPDSVWTFDIARTESGFRMLAASDDEPLECGVVAVVIGDR